MIDPFEINLVYKELLTSDCQSFWAVYETARDAREDYIATVLFLHPVPPEKPDAYIGWIGVVERYQRTGLATVLLDRIRSRYRCGIDFGVTTTDGEAFQRKYEQHAKVIESPPPQVG